jgi:hypothetical protein
MEMNKSVLLCLVEHMVRVGIVPRAKWLAADAAVAACIQEDGTLSDEYIRVKARDRYVVAADWGDGRLDVNIDVDAAVQRGEPWCRVQAWLLVYPDRAWDDADAIRVAAASYAFGSEDKPNLGGVLAVRPDAALRQTPEGWRVEGWVFVYHCPDTD